MADKPKGGILARRAGMWCQDKSVWVWLDSKRKTVDGFHNADTTKEWLCNACQIESRAEIDHDAYATAMFTKIYKAWQDDQTGYSKRRG